MAKPLCCKSCGLLAILGGRFWGVGGERLCEDCFVMLEEVVSASRKRRRERHERAVRDLSKLIARAKLKADLERKEMIGRAFAKGVMGALK